MSELKAVHAFDVYEAYTKTGDDDAAQVYLKSEADKVIAELKDRLHAADKQIENLINNASRIMLLQDRANDNKCTELIRQKYKRCLAMARWCFTKSNYHFVLARHGEDAKENNRKSILYSKWCKRWIAIADKYKEGN